MQLPNVGNVALNALTYPVTTSFALGILRAMKSLLTSDRRDTSHGTQIGYLLAMVNGGVNFHVGTVVVNIMSEAENYICLHAGLPTGALAQYRTARPTPVP